jgi:glycosyltransferase involved in cell wall biosynthesis
MKPLLSIVIATKNREFYCIEAIKSILMITNNTVEIAISDNSDTEQVKEFVTQLNDDRIVYRYDVSPISSIENFNRCLGLATGEYVCMIGDDDSILPNLLKVAQWAKENDIDSVTSTHMIDYIWPNINIESFKTGMLVLSDFKKTKEIVDARENLNKLVRDGFLDYQTYKLPRIYHGLIKKSCMDEIKRLTANYFGGLSPDIYSSVALSCIVKKHYVIGFPCTITGACASSTTVQAKTGEHSGSIESIPHLKNRGDYVWDKKVPMYYSVETIWAESGLKSLIDMNQAALYDKFYAYPLFAKGILINGRFILKLVLNKTEQVRKQRKDNLIIFWVLVSFFLGLEAIKLINYIVKTRIFKTKIRNRNVENIADAVEIVNQKCPTFI